jgi:hypothetical protein
MHPIFTGETDVKFDPKTEEEIAQGGLLPKSDCDFEVVNAEEDQSKAGNDMITLALHVYNSDGGYHKVKDWLVATVGGAYKVRHFAYAVGMGAEYERGELSAANLRGCTGRCKIGIQKQEGYPDKNNVVDYLPPPVKNGVAMTPAEGRAALDDDIPF